LSSSICRHPSCDFFDGIVARTFVSISLVTPLQNSHGFSLDLKFFG
jgi:hypothetical protein